MFLLPFIMESVGRIGLHQSCLLKTEEARKELFMPEQTKHWVPGMPLTPLQAAVAEDLRDDEPVMSPQNKFAVPISELDAKVNELIEIKHAAAREIRQRFKSKVWYSRNDDNGKCYRHQTTPAGTKTQPLDCRCVKMTDEQFRTVVKKLKGTIK